MWTSLPEIPQISLETANKFYAYGWRASLAGAFVTAIGVMLLFWGTRVRDRDFEAQVGALNQEAGDARERAGKLEKEAADARSETERLKHLVAWRSISQETASKLEKVLATKPGNVNLRYTDGDPEALFFAIQVSKILSKAHWQVASGPLKPFNAIVFGISLPDDAGADAQTLRTAFLTTKIPFSPNPVPEGLELLSMKIQGAPMLMIGSRSPPRISVAGQNSQVGHNRPNWDTTGFFAMGRTGCQNL